MTELVIHGVEESVVQRLQARASTHGRTLEAEARSILEEAVQPMSTHGWAAVDAIRERLAASGRAFSDSAQLLREDRER